MQRRLAVVSALFAIAAPGAVAAQDAAAVSDRSSTGEEPTSQILAGMLGVEIGGRVSPGGLRVGGSYLYRLNERDWVDAGVGFTFGSGGAACFRDRDDDFLCDHGVASGFAGEVIAAIRRQLAARDNFEPFVRVGVALRLIGFGADDVVGFGIPVLGSAGIRARVHPTLSIVATADLRVGWAFFNQDLGGEPNVSAAIGVGVEFDLD